MLETNHVINLMWPVGMFFVHKAMFAAVPGAHRYSFPKIIRDLRTQAGVSGGPGLWLGSADARVEDSRRVRLAQLTKYVPPGSLLLIPQPAQLLLS
jgi:hypothetical protein